MGWLFGWNTRKELADHLLYGNGVKTIKHCFKGNNVWAVQEYTYPDTDWDGAPHPKAGQVTRFIGLYLIKGGDTYNVKTGRRNRDGWGYKDMDESAGPCYYNCPLAYLDMVPDPGGDASGAKRCASITPSVPRSWSPARRSDSTAVNTRLAKKKGVASTFGTTP